MGRKPSQWELYERLVARLVADQLSTAYCVTPNARIHGKFSDQARQVDVLIDPRHGAENHRRIVIDAKAHARPIDVTHVEAFRSFMEDVEATHGYLVCPNGFTPAAERRAQDSVSIRLLPLDRLDDFDPSNWPECHVPSCRHGRVFWDGYPSVDLTLAPAMGAAGPLQKMSFIHYVGKCDRCSRFHVKCLSCGAMLSIDHEGDDSGTVCNCSLPWFWLASIERDEAGRPSAELHLVMPAGQVRTVDRRSL
jgi:hypothetical protein